MSDGLKLSTKKMIFEMLCDKAEVVIPSRDTLPVLKNFQIEASESGVKVLATDMELSVIASTSVVTVERPGSVVLPAKKLRDILREGSDDELVLEVEDKTASLQIGRASWELVLLQDSSDYPELPDVFGPRGHETMFHTIERDRFLSALQSVRYAAATAATRQNLMMVDVSPDPETGKGRLTACDGVRFQRAGLGVEFPVELQIPIGAVEDLVKLLRSTDVATIAIGNTEHRIVFKVGHDIFIANKLMAQFPDIEGLLLRPALQNKHELMVDREEFEHAVKRVRINADPETSAIALELSDNRITLISKDVHGNRATEMVEAAWSSGERLICVNHAFLTDMLRMYDGPSCHFMLGDDIKTRKSTVMLRDDEAETVGIISQMRSDWILDE